MVTLRNKWNLSALNKENCEEHARSNLEQNSKAPRRQEDYITQISEEIEGRIRNILCQEFIRTESCILGALSRLGDFLLNPLTQGQSRTSSETSRNACGTNQWTNEDDSQSDPHHEAIISQSQTTQNSVPEDVHDTECCNSCVSLLVWMLESNFEGFGHFFCFWQVWFRKKC